MSRLGTSVSRQRNPNNDFDDDFDNIDYGSNYGLDPLDDYHLVRPISTAELQDDYPIGDLIPDSSRTDELYHQGNRYLPVQSTNDYDVYELQQEQEPPQFYGNTTHNDEYYWKEGTRKAPDTPESPRVLPPFTGDTTNKAAYIPHVPVKKEVVNETPQPVSRIPFQGKTSNQLTYTPKNGQRTKVQRPQTKIGTNPGEFNGATVSQATYKNQSARPPTRYTANDHLGVGGEFFGKTTNAADYVDHPLQGKPLRRRNSAPTLQPGAMESKTTNQRTYTPKKASTCPAEKLLLARRQNKLNGVSRNGHFFVPVSKSGKVLQNLTSIKNQTLQQKNKSNSRVQSTAVYGKDGRPLHYSPPPAVRSPFSEIRPIPTSEPTPQVPVPQNSLPNKRIAAPQRHLRTAAAVGFPIA